MNPREAALAAFGETAVAGYERVKRFYTRLGLAVEAVFAERVGGRCGSVGEPDVVTRLGGFEFCSAANTKNAAGDAAQFARVGPGRVVQVSGRPRPGRISAAAFLALHGVLDPAALDECFAAAVELARAEQLALPLGSLEAA